MRGSICRNVIVLFCVIAVMLITAGCEEQNASPPNERKARLVGAENLELKKQLEQRDAEIEDLKENLDKCLRAQRDAGKSSQEVFGKVIELTAKENQNLREENKNLKSQIEDLKKQLDNIKGAGGPTPL
jgi:predicted RNase H-like nuclease (RuvC/YqgF family)